MIIELYIISLLNIFYKITVKYIRIQRNWKILIILRSGYFEDYIFFKSLPNPKALYCISELNN